jgi:hypothetical protein
MRENKGNKKIKEGLEVWETLMFKRAQPKKIKM